MLTVSVSAGQLIDYSVAAGWTVDYSPDEAEPGAGLAGNVG